MKILPGRGAARALLIALAILGVALGVASAPWHAERAVAPPRVVQAAGGAGSLRAGAAAVPFSLPAGVPIGGFARLSYRSEGVPDPVGARALVLQVPGCKVALVSAEILLVPEALEEAVRARVSDLRLDGLVLAATHTHAGPGGFWEHLAGERIATGPYDPRVRDAVVDAIAAALRDADAALAPARVAVARGTAGELVRSRSGGADGGRLTVLRVERDGGGRAEAERVGGGAGPIAELVVFGAHPTMLGQANRRISGDWVGRFLADGRRGVRLFFQGALGDQSVAGPVETPERYAAALSARVAALEALEAPSDLPSPRSQAGRALALPSPPARAGGEGRGRGGAGSTSARPELVEGRATQLAYASVEVTLPSPEPGAAPRLLRRAAANLAHGMFPATARVSAVRIGDLALAAVPAEPVAALAQAWRASLPPGTEVVSLAAGYLGYVEEPARVTEGAGETVRTYFGPELAGRLQEAVRISAQRGEHSR